MMLIPILPCMVLSFDFSLGMMDNKYAVSIKQLPLHKEPVMASEIIEVLSLGDIVIEVKDSSLSDNDKTKWIKVKSKDNEELIGYIHHKAVVTDSLYQDVLNNTSILLNQTNESIDSIPLKQKKAQKNLAKNDKKGFSDEERIHRSVKKGFAKDEDNCQNCNKINNIHLKEELQMQIVTRSEIKNFANKGELK